MRLLIENFQAAYKPPQNLSLDESLLLFKCRLLFRQYMKGKKAKYGIKLYELCSSEGYVLNLEVYQGKSEGSSGKINNIVLRLLEPYLNKGHHIFMDNFYNNVDLSKTLLSYRTHTTGTLRANRKNNPKDIVTKKLSKGKHIWKRNQIVYVSKWRDNRDVLSITTYPHPKMVDVPKRFGRMKKKPAEIALYNDNMSGIDRCDQMVSYYSSPRKSVRFYKKVLFNFLDISTWNSFFIYRILRKNNISCIEFRDILIKEMVQLPDFITTGRDSFRTDKTRKAMFFNCYCCSGS